MQLKFNLNIPGTPPLEYQESTHQVPKGPGSLFDMLAKRHLTASQAIILLVINYFSRWDKGISKFLSLNTLAKCVNMKRSRVNMIIRVLTKKTEGARWRWLTAIKGKSGKHRYQQAYHQQLPLAEMNIVGDISMEPKDRKFAVPYGQDSPMQMMIDGNLTWQACLLWHIYRLHSDFKTTQLKEPIGILDAAKLSGLGTSTISKANQELINAGLLEPLSKGREKGFFQLFPKIKKALTGKKPKKVINGLYYNDTHVYSFNRQYRMRRDTLQLERKRKRKGWKRVSDYERAEHTYQKIIEDLEAACIKLGEPLSLKPTQPEKKQRSAIVDGIQWTFRPPLLE